MRCDRDAPGQFADLDGLGDLLRGDIDHGHIVRDTVGDQQVFFVGCEGHVPDPLANQQVFADLMGGGIDHGDPVGRPECHERRLAVFGDADADRLDRLAPHPGNREADLGFDRAFLRIDDGDRAADFRGDPKLGIVALELGEPRPRVDQHIADDLARGGVDEVRHVGGLGRIDQKLAVRADRHAFRLDPDLHVADARAFGDVDDGHGVVVLVGDIEGLAGGVLHEQLGIRAGGQGVDHLPGRGVDHLDGIVIADRHHHELAVAGELDSPRPLPYLDGRGHLPGVGIDHRDRVAFLIRDIGHHRAGR